MRTNRRTSPTQAAAKASRRPRPAGLLVAALVATLGVWLAADALAQKAAPPRQQVLVGAPNLAPATAAVGGGASVETAADALGLIERAGNDIEDGQLDSAVRRLMYAAERFGSSLIELKSGVLVPTSRYVDQVVSSWAKDRPEALATYRRIADAEAIGVLGGPVDEVRDDAKLAAVVDRYLLSSMGDEAAYALACHWIDQGRFAEAATLLQRLLRVYPDPSIDRREAAVRLALAHGRSGAAAKRDQALAELPKLGVADRVVDRIAEASRPRRGATASRGDWPMAGGRPDRLGVMPSLSARAREMPQELWAPLWSYKAAPPIGKLVDRLRASIHRNYTIATSQPAMLRRWERYDWRPTFQLAAAGDKLCYVVAGELHCLNTQTGRRAWKPITLSRASMAELGGNNRFSYTSRQNQDADVPEGIEEVFSFGDNVMTDLSIADGTVYYLEPAFGMGSDGRVRLVINNGRVSLRDLYDANQLVAVDLSTGKVRWRAPVRSKHDEDDGASTPRTRTVVAPVPVGDALLTVAEDDGDLVLASISPEDGRTIWRRFLCSAESSFAPSWSRVGLAVDGQAAFIATNRGLVFAVDAGTGDIRWATRYDRKEVEQTRRGFNYSADWAGETSWDNAHVLPVGGQLYVLAADAKNVLVIDRFSGQVASRLKGVAGIDLDKMEFLAGATRERIMLGGPEGLLAIEPGSSKLQWYAPMPERLVGRPAVAADLIYVPTQTGVVEIEAETGRRANVMAVGDQLDEPVGNLFVADGHLFAGVGGRVTALGNARLQIERLSDAAENGDVGALAARAQLYAQIGRVDRAIDDLRTEFKLRKSGEGKTDAAGRLIDLLAAKALTNPRDADDALDEAVKYAQNLSQKLSVRLTRARVYAAAGETERSLRIYHEIAMADPGQPRVVGNDQTWRARPDVIGREQMLALIHSGDDVAVREKLESLGRPALEDALQALADAGDSKRKNEALTRLRRVATVHPGADAAGEAIVALGAAIQDDALFNAAESALRELATTRQPRNAALASSLLADAYTRRQWVDAATAAYRNTAARLAMIQPAPATESPDPNNADDPPPQPAAADAANAAGDADAGDADAQNAAADEAEVADGEAPADPAQAKAPAPVEPEDSIAALLPTIDQVNARLDELAKIRGRAVDRPPYKEIWRVERGNTQLLAFNGSRPASPQNMYFGGFNSSTMMPGGAGDVDLPDEPNYGWRTRHLLAYASGTERLTAYNARTGKRAWAAPLPNDVEGNLTRYGRLKLFSGGIDGHTLALATPSRALAIDLLTGKRLWTSERSISELAQSSRRQSRSFYDGFRRTGSFADAGAGVLAEAVEDDDSGGTDLLVRDIQTGQPRWVRTFPGRQVNGLSIVGDRVAVLFDANAAAAVFDVRTGRQLNRFDTADTRSASAYRMWTPHGLVTQDSQRQVILQPLEPDAKGWTYAPNNQYMRSWHRVGGDYLMILWNGNRMELLDLRTGKPAVTVNDNNLPRTVADAALSDDGGRLVLIGNQSSKQTLVEIDVEAGKIVGRHEAGRFYNYYAIGAEAYRASDRVMPIMVRQGNRNDKFKLQVVDLARNKQLVDDSPTFKMPIDAPRVRDGVIILSTQEGLIAIGGKNAADGSDRSDAADGADKDARREAPGKDREQAAKDLDPDVTAKPANNNQVIIKANGKEVRIDVRDNARVQMKDGKLIVNGRVVALPADAAKAKAKAEAEAKAEREAGRRAAGDEAVIKVEQAKEQD